MTIPADQKRILTNLVGDPNGTLNAGSPSPLDDFWDRNIQYAAIGNGRLQELYTQRDAIDARLAEEVPSTDLNVEGEISDAQSQRFNHLYQMKQQVQTEIARMSQVARGSGVGASASGAITKTTPESVPSGFISPNSDHLRGSAFHRGRGDGWW